MTGQMGRCERIKSSSRTADIDVILHSRKMTTHGDGAHTVTSYMTRTR